MGNGLQNSVRSICDVFFCPYSRCRITFFLVVEVVSIIEKLNSLVKLINKV